MGVLNVVQQNTGDGQPWLKLVAGGGISYDTIQQSIGQGYQFGLNGLYMKANNVSQLLQPVTLEKNNRRGIFELKQYIPTVDPYQLLSAINSDVIDEKENESLTFNGLQNFVIPIEAGETVVFVFSLQEQSTNNLIPSPTNFELLEYYDFLADFPDKDAGSGTQRDLLVQVIVENRSNLYSSPFLAKVSLLGGAPDTYAQSSNATTRYLWNTFTPEPYDVPSFSIDYKLVGAPTYSALTLFGSFNTLQAWATALNSQTGLGLFWIDYSNTNNPVLMTTNDRLEFGNITYAGTL
jgi:hypothetical protein